MGPGLFFDTTDAKIILEHNTYIYFSNNIYSGRKALVPSEYLSWQHNNGDQKKEIEDKSDGTADSSGITLCLNWFIIIYTSIQHQSQKHIFTYK